MFQQPDSSIVAMADPDVPHRGIAPPNDALSAVRVAFPQTEEDFEHDDRVSFSKVDNKWILEDVNGEWEWLAAHKKWIPSVRPHPLQTRLFAPEASCWACERLP